MGKGLLRQRRQNRQYWVPRNCKPDLESSHGPQQHIRVQSRGTMVETNNKPRRNAQSEPGLMGVAMDRSAEYTFRRASDGAADYAVRTGSSHNEADVPPRAG